MSTTTTAVGLSMPRRADVRDFGANPDGDPEANQRALQAAIDWLVEGTAPAEFFIPNPICNFVRPIHIKVDGIIISHPRDYQDDSGMTISREPIKP